MVCTMSGSACSLVVLLFCLKTIEKADRVKCTLVFGVFVVVPLEVLLLGNGSEASC